MNYAETPIHFDCAGERLLGIVSTPEANQARAETGVVIIVGGPQYRVGSHRQFVQLARSLAEVGFSVLRFDYRGMGDSTGELRSFENISEDIEAAITALQAATGVTGVALWGLCDGASAALLYCHAKQDARVKGLCLLNPWVRSEVSLAKTRVKHYYTQRLRQKDFWVKLLRGKVAAGAALGLAQSIRRAVVGHTAEVELQESHSFQSRMAVALEGFDGSVLLILSGDDYTAKEFTEYVSSNREWKRLSGLASVLHHEIENADHTFSSAVARIRVEALTLTWLNARNNP